MKLSALLFATGAAAAILTLGAASPPPADLAETYYACSSGYTFQVNDDAARCFKPASTVDQSTLCVGPGMTKMKDVVGVADHCKPPGVGATVAVICTQFGFSLKAQSGWDVCQSTIPAESKAPLLQVTRTGTVASVPGPAAAGTYYRCAVGSFQVNNQAARCYAPASTVAQSTVCVGPGMTKMKDVVGVADHCKPPGFGVTVAVICTQSGFSLKAKSGWDQCEKTTPAVSSAPSLPTAQTANLATR